MLDPTLEILMLLLWSGLGIYLDFLNTSCDPSKLEVH